MNNINITKPVFEDRYRRILKSIATSETRDQLQVCSKMKDSFLSQVREFQSVDQVKFSLEGMLALREYQLKNQKQ